MIARAVLFLLAVTAWSCALGVLFAWLDARRSWAGDHEPLEPGERPAGDWVMREVREAERHGELVNAMGFGITDRGGWRRL